MRKNILATIILLVIAAAAAIAVIGLTRQLKKDQAESGELKNVDMPKTSETAPLIPRSVLFGNPDKWDVQLSPDGTKISYLANVNGVANVWVGPRDNPNSAKPVTRDKGRGIRTYLWAYNNHILFLQDNNGDENWVIYSADLKTGAIKALTLAAKVAAGITKTSEKFPEEILIGLNDRDPKFHDIWRVNISTGQKTWAVPN